MIPASITIYYGGNTYTFTVSALTIAVTQNDLDTVTFEKAMCPMVFDGSRWFIDGLIYLIVDYHRHE